MQFAKNLKSRRLALGLTQRQVADLAAMPQPAYARLESGGRENPRIDTLQRLAKALRTTPDKLLK
ncbi:MAG: helix-turn-helix transcriptional regulator [Opitutaceae bacterium]